MIKRTFQISSSMPENINAKCFPCDFESKFSRDEDRLNSTKEDAYLLPLGFDSTFHPRQCSLYYVHCDFHFFLSFIPRFYAIPAFNVKIFHCSFYNKKGNPQAFTFVKHVNAGLKSQLILIKFECRSFNNSWKYLFIFVAWKFKKPFVHALIKPESVVI